MRIARGTHDPRIASKSESLIARITVGHHLADEVAGHEELVRPVIMAADCEIEGVDRHGQAAVGPDPPRDTRASLGPRFAKDLVDPLGLRVAFFHRRNLRRQKQRHSGFVGAQRPAGDHFVPQIQNERSDADCRGEKDIQQRASSGRPAAAREAVLLAIDRQMIAILGGNDLGGHAGVVAIALDQALRPSRFLHAAFHRVFTSELGNSRDEDRELGPLDHQRLLDVVTDQLPLAVRGTMLDFRGRFERDFATRQMGGQGLVALLPRLAHAALVLGDDQLGLFHRLGQTFRRVGRLGRVAEVNLQLVRIFSITFTAIAVGALQKLVDRELLFLDLLMQLRDRFGLRNNRAV